MFLDISIYTFIYIISFSQKFVVNVNAISKPGILYNKENLECNGVYGSICNKTTWQRMTLRLPHASSANQCSIPYSLSV